MSVSTVIVQIISLNRISQGGSIIRSRRSCIIAVAGRNKKPLCVSDSQKKVLFLFFYLRNQIRTSPYPISYVVILIPTFDKLVDKRD